ncbi:hypothetical protein ONA91_22590 [Micromonospora sp. DR5-3]|uniref:hypothetical protein n=1 Tax=unclassified Micromonospora TaxID=2617518 RepID=UPI0011D498B2|nr:MULTISPECIES: hypothetical protein [unclassified Micromonospora]MCW3817245.1 hypothetical protein [Micromonospora sp. DR5-3]TYC26248.1 hypothetical protein FXF52_02550 [Micromonospora sp. MP36]
MGDGIVVPTDKLTSTAEVLKALATSADQIADGLAKADPPDVLWGALGAAFMKGTYDGTAEQARDHIRTISKALHSQGGAIKASADRYQELDAALQQALEQAFERFQDKLSGGK